MGASMAQLQRTHSGRLVVVAVRDSRTSMGRSADSSTDRYSLPSHHNSRRS